MDEKRRYQRINYREPVLYRILLDQPQTGCLGYDISSGGLRCTVNDFIPLGQQLKLTVKLKREEPLELTGRVVWIRRNAHGENYQIGLKFTETEAVTPTRQRVDQFIEEARSFS